MVTVAQSLRTLVHLPCGVLREGACAFEPILVAGSAPQGE
jgi:hypothetical protein